MLFTFLIIVLFPFYIYNQDKKNFHNFSQNTSIGVLLVNRWFYCSILFVLFRNRAKYRKKKKSPNGSLRYFPEKKFYVYLQKINFWLKILFRENVLKCFSGIFFRDYAPEPFCFVSYLFMLTFNESDKNN